MRRLAFPAVLILAMLAGACWWRLHRTPPTPPPEPAQGHPPVASPQKDLRQVTVYLARETAGTNFALSPVQRAVSGKSPASLAEASLKTLAIGPTAAERAHGLLAPLPEGTRVLGVKVEGGVAIANFSQELQDHFNGGAEWEEIVLYSIVNTVTAIEGVRGVRVQIAGLPVESIGGHLAADELLRKDDALVLRGKTRE